MSAVNFAKKVLVTGGSGFVGSFLVDELQKRGLDVLSLDLRPPYDSKVKTIIGSVVDKDVVMDATQGCDFVCHLAGLLGTHELVDNSFQATTVNVIGTLNVLEACKYNNSKLILASKPNLWVNTYTITKCAAESFTEMYRREHGVEATVVKWFNVYGSRQPLVEEIGYKKLIPTAIVCALRSEDVLVYGDGKQTMDLIHVLDTVEATISIMERWIYCEGNTFEIGSGVEITVNEAVEKILSRLQSTSKVIHVPMRKGEVDNTCLKANICPLNKLTGWSSRISLEEGLDETINWYTARYSK